VRPGPAPIGRSAYANKSAGGVLRMACLRATGTIAMSAFDAVDDWQAPPFP